MRQAVRATGYAPLFALILALSYRISGADPPVTALGAYQTPTDHFQHAIAATSDGKIHEVFFNPQAGIGEDILENLEGLVDLDAYYTPSDGNQHIIAATNDGWIHELYFNPQAGLNQDLLANLPGAVSVAAYYTPNDGFQHAIVATNDGAVHEIFFKPQVGIGQDTLTTLPGVTRIAAFQTPDDNYQHVIAATRDGTIEEVFFNPTFGIGQAPLANFTGVVDVAGFYTNDDHDRHAIVATVDGQIHEVYYNPSTGIGQDVLATFPGVVAVAGYYTPDDGFRHVIVATDTGALYEIFFKPSLGIFQDQLTTLGPTPPGAADISPNAANGQVSGSSQPVGVILATGGDASMLYAVSQGAGLWRSAGGGPWQQLPNAPPLAYSLAVDPANHNHLVVGEREGDAANASANFTGAWESTNAGDSWTMICDPKREHACPSGVIPAVAFSQTGTLLVATDCGIGRRPVGAATVDFTASPPNAGLITALAVGENSVWARSTSQIFRSTDDGLHWTVRNIPPQVDGFNVTFGSLGDPHSLGAFDGLAVMPFKPDPDPTGNRGTVLVYDAVQDTWHAQVVGTVGDGTGLGGRRFMRSFVLNSGTDTLGDKLQLFFGVAQDIVQATGRAGDGTIFWDTPVTTDYAGSPNPASHIHSDLWDFYIPPSFAPTNDAGPVWVTCDGGVYQGVPAGGNASRIALRQWQTRGDGLHTQHAHSILVQPNGNGREPTLSYPTTDNDAWFKGPGTGWQTPNYLGDAGWTAGDAAVPSVVLLARRPGTLPFSAIIEAVSGKLPNGQTNQPVEIAGDYSFSYHQFFIQSLPGEAPSPFLDAVMLAHLPLTDDAGTPVPGPLGQPHASLVIVRNPAWTQTPDANLSRYSGWHLEADNVPAGAVAVLPSGGHANPIYYVLATGATTQLGLYKQHSPGSTQWDRLSLPSLPSTVFEPVFVNPYDPSRIYAWTSSGVRVSRNGGASFDPDPVLDHLLTNSGEYPTAPLFTNFYDLPNSSRANNICPLSAVAFSRENLDEVAVSTPYNGVFYASDGHTWRDIGRYMPRPLAPVSGVGIDAHYQAVYAITEGQGLFQIGGYRLAPPASYADFRDYAIPGGSLGTIQSTDGTAVAGASVALTLFPLHSRGSSSYVVTTDTAGHIPFPSAAPGAFLAQVDLPGSASHGPLHTRVVVSRVVPGDTNQDNRVTLVDAAMTLQAIQGRLTLSAAQGVAADVDRSGAVTGADVTAILRIVGGLGTG